MLCTCSFLCMEWGLPPPSFLLPSLQPPGSLPSFPILGQIPPLKTSPIPLERPRASISGDPLALWTTMIAIGWVYNKCIVMCLSPPITLVSIYGVFPWNRYYTNFGPMFSLDHQSNSAKWPFFFSLVACRTSWMGIQIAPPAVEVIWEEEQWEILKRDLISLPSNSTWVTWMKTKSPSH